MRKCGLCMGDIPDDYDCRAMDLEYHNGVYFHHHCWDNMIRYAQFRGWIQ